MKPFLGFCHISKGDDLFQLTAAVLCESAEDFEALVRAEITHNGYWLHWVNSVLPLSEWLSKHPSDWGAQLVSGLDIQCPVILGPLEPISRPSNPIPNWLRIEDIGEVEPLDSQFGVFDRRSVPEILHAPLFDQPSVEEGGPPLNTYAVLDAAKMPYLLPGFLDGSGLHYESLLQGQAQEELENHAPYLVALEDDNHFTRRLFTGPKGVNGIWHKVTPFMIRTPVDFSTLRKHLRKFLRIQDEAGKWYYFRFWELGVSARAFWLGNHLDLHPLISPFFPATFELKVILMLDNHAVRLSRLENTTPVRTTSVFTNAARRTLVDIRRSLQFNELTALAIKHAQIEDVLAQNAAVTQLESQQSLIFSLGFWRRDHIVKLCLWELMLGPDFLRNYAQKRVWEACHQPWEPHEKMNMIENLIQQEGNLEQDEPDGY